MTIARGARHGRAKLTARQVRAIRTTYPKRSYRALAARYGVSAQQIMRIVRRIHWTH